MKNNKLITLKTILWLITGLASTIMVFRLVKGLGVSTNLTDNTPWGLWIGFDVFSGVALAAGGFIVCAVVYIFHMEEYRPLARPAVLTAFLGYIAVAVGLFFDLGVPWRIWHPTIYWQHHSALFEVGWCVMLYLTVLLLEFSPVVLEKINIKPFKIILKFLKRFTIVFVLLGIMLSVLHQSSLGTLFLIMPNRLHPLWYSSLQPLLFFISAVGLGLAMVTLESLSTSWLYNRKSEEHLLNKVGRFIPLILGLYLVIRLGEIFYRGNFGLMFDGSRASFLFIIEILISSIIPIILFSVKSIRENKTGLVVAAAFVIIGIVLHRIDVGIISSYQTTGEIYFPTFMEFLTSMGIVSIAILVFLFFVENFSVYDSKNDGNKQLSKDFDIVTNGRLFDAGLGMERRYSFVFILGASLAIFLLPENGLWQIKPESTPVQPPRVVNVDTLSSDYTIDRVSNSDPVSMISTTKTLLIDGNRNNRSVLFSHDAHITKNTKAPGCGYCHHMNLTAAIGSACSQCHRDMYIETDVFIHNDHINAEGGNKGCGNCHINPSAVKNRKTSIPCSDCHKMMKANDSFILVDNDWRGYATGYMQAMHGLCLKCHEQKEKEAGKIYRTGISGCSTCHKDDNSKLYALTKPDLPDRKTQ